MADQPLIAYPPIKRIIKQEIPDQEEEGNWTLQLPEDSSVTTTDDTTSVTSLMIANAILPSKDSGKGKERLRAPPNQSVQDLPATKTFEEEETLQDTEMTDQELESDEEDKSEHSSLEDSDEFDRSLDADSTDEMDFSPSPKAGPSGSQEPRQEKQTSQCKKREGSDSTAPKKRRFKCTKCGRSYSTKGSLNSHLKFECGIGSHFPCSQCDGQFKRKHFLQRHLMNVHKIDRNQLDKHGVGFMDRKRLAFKCTKCDSSFKLKRTLVQHMRNECGVAFQCTLCKQNHTTKSTLRNHLFSIHNIARRKLLEYGAGYMDRFAHPYKCAQCGRTYKKKNSLTRHLTVECGIEPSFPCPQCDCRCKHKSSLKNHLMEMHNVKRS